MSISWPWVALAAWVVAAVVAGVVWRSARAADDASAVLAAHTDRLRELPSYRARARRHRRWLVVGGAAALALLAGTSALAARPLRERAVPPVIDNRDIVLCLDVSGSMVEYNRSILDRFGELIVGFDGERVGMTIFNSSAVPAFPLTTDHLFILDEFERFRTTFRERGIDALGGTLEGDGTSLVPDGIASCALSLPERADGRSRAMVVATDNVVEGPSLLSIPQVAALLVQRDIRAYVLFPMFDFETERLGADEMRQLATTSGGRFFGTENPTAVPAIIDEVEALEAARLDVEPTEVRYPDTTVWLLVASIAAVVLGWAAERARR